MPTSDLIRVWTSVVMGWPESVSYLLLVVLGYALTRVVDLACDWQRGRLNGATDASTGSPADGSNANLSATARQRLIERRAVYARFRKSASDAVESAVNQGDGTYGMLYQIRDDYGELLRQAPIAVTHAADSMIRCVTLLLNLGPSDQRFAMFTRALSQFDQECSIDQGLGEVLPGPRTQEFSVIADVGAHSGSTGVSLEERFSDERGDVSRA